MRAPSFAVLGVAHLLAALRSLLNIDRDDGVPLIAELLSARGCPAALLLLLRLAAAGSLAASSAALALALAAPGAATPAGLWGGLAGHAAVGLCGSRIGSSAQPLSMLAGAQPPRALHWAGLAACAHDAAVGLSGRRRTTTAPAFLLDIDGTLVLTDALYFDAFKELLAPLGITVDEPWYTENVHGKTDAQVFGRLLPDANDEEIREWGLKKDALFCKLYRERCAEGPPPTVGGLAEALELARSLGVRAIAVTNAPRGAAEACIESLRGSIPAASIIHPTIIIGAECSRAKPHPDPYETGAALLGVPMSECVVFEDSRT